jgi:hypothetical protein
VFGKNEVLEFTHIENNDECSIERVSSQFEVGSDFEGRNILTWHISREKCWTKRVNKSLLLHS